MVRIIPWNLPPVNGGSIGGYTPKVEPAPEPTPVPYNYPYILDDIVIVDPTLAIKHGSLRSQQGESSVNAYYYWYQGVGNTVTIGISGVEIVDTQNVSSVIAKIHASGTLAYTYYTRSYNPNYAQKTETKTISNLNVDINIDISAIMTESGGTATNNSANVGGAFENYLGFFRNSSSPSGTAMANPVNQKPVITTLPTLSLVKITAYNGNGVPIQEWTPPEEEEE